MRLDLPLHISASQLTCYTMCPRKYRFRYVEQRAPETKSAALVLGSAFHSAVEWHFSERRAGRMPTLTQVKDTFEADLCAGLADGPIDMDAETRAALLTQGHGMLDVFLDESGELDVCRTEYRFELAPEDEGRPFLGYFDLVLEDGTIVELKTAARRFSNLDLETNLQFASYRWAAGELGAKGLRVIAVTKTKTPKLQVIELQPAAESEARWFRKVVSEFEDATEAGSFPPSPSQRCSGCEYRSACREDV